MNRANRIVYRIQAILRLAILIVFVVVAAAACSDPDQPEARKTGPASRPQAGVIVAMGNSLTEGLRVPEEQAYPAVLERKLQEAGQDYRVINAGISGETSSGALSRMEWVLTLAPDIVILETGANDGFRGVDPELIRENIRKMVRRFTENGTVVVLGGMKMVRNLGVQYINGFDTLYQQVAAEEGVILIPFFLEGVVGNHELNQNDNIHPNADGYKVVADTVFPYVLEAIGRKARKQEGQ